MRISRLRKRLLIGGTALAIVVAAGGAAALTIGNDLYCSGSESGAFSEFPHYADARPDWESNFKISGGCTAAYTIEADASDVRDYYREALAQRGWAVSEGPPNSSPLFLIATREDLDFSLNFATASLPLTTDGGEALREKQRQAAEGVDENALRPGQTLVSIAGGHR